MMVLVQKLLLWTDMFDAVSIQKAVASIVIQTPWNINRIFSHCCQCTLLIIMLAPHQELKFIFYDNIFTPINVWNLKKWM